MSQFDERVALRPEGHIVDLTVQVAFDGLDEVAEGRIINGLESLEGKIVVRRSDQVIDLGGVAEFHGAVQLVDMVAGVDLEFRQLSQNVGLGHDQVGHAVGTTGIGQFRQVEPAAATGTTGGGAEFATHLAQEVAFVAEKLGREGTIADTRSVGLEHAEDAADLLRRNAAVAEHAGHRGEARGDERICAVVDIEQCALGTLGQHFLVVDEQLMQESGHVHHLIALQGLLVAPEELELVGQILVLTFHFLDEQIGRDENGVDLLHEFVVGETQITDSDSQAIDHVHVGRPDAATGGTDLGSLQSIEFSMERENDRTAGRNAQPVGIVDADSLLEQRPDLSFQRFGIHDHTRTDQVRRMRIEDSGRNQMQDDLLAVLVNGVAGVVAALEAENIVVVCREEIADLALALVAVLKTENDIDRHDGSPPGGGTKRTAPWKHCLSVVYEQK